MDLKMMDLCLRLAQDAENKGEVPIGAAIVDLNGNLIAKAGNIRESERTVLGHAELAVLQRACKKLGTWRLPGCTLYVTLEPCTMCAAAIMQARISRVVFGANDPKAGAMGSVLNLGEASHMHHKIKIQSGILEAECSHLLKSFFKKRRSQSSTKGLREKV